MGLTDWVNRDDISFKDDAAKHAYRTKAQRIADVIQQKTPDRVPFWLQDNGYFPCNYTGITYKAAAYDFNAWFDANKRTLIDFDVDMLFNPGIFMHSSGQGLEALDPTFMRWPGHGISDNSCHQFVEAEYMKADEYDAFLSDMSDYVWRVFMPRAYGNLKALSQLPPLFSFGTGMSVMSGIFHDPAINEALTAIYQAGIEAVKRGSATAKFIKEMAGLGFPTLTGAVAQAPFDTISDFFRGMRGAMLDMYRCPDKLHAAMEKILPLNISSAIGQAKSSGNPGVFIPLHRGGDAFMSKSQFIEFYWPGLERLVLSLIDADLVPCVFIEGDCTSRLDLFATFPKGNALAMFENSDIRKLKSVLGTTMGLSGGMPLSSLRMSTPDQVKEQTKELIDILGKDGGYVMAPKTVMDNANPELVRVWVDFTREYGRYR